MLYSVAELVLGLKLQESYTSLSLLLRVGLYVNWFCPVRGSI
jgi:hypothetical protein